MPEPLAPFQPGDVVRIRGERWIVLRHTTYGNVAILDVTGADRTNRPERTRFVLPFEPIDPLPSSRVPRVVRATAWRRIARHVLADALSPRDLLRTIASARATVFPFQLEPALAVLRGLGSRVLIADEVGLGKTVQAGIIVAELLARLPDAHALIVSPAGLRDQWRGELGARFGIDAALIDSPTLARFGRTAVGFNPWRSSSVVIASIDYIKRPEVLRAVEAVIWDAVIFDEVHTLSGRSDRASAAASLADRARLLVMLTATPHSGDDLAFSRLCNVGRLSQRSPLLVFRRTRRDVGLPASRRTTWLRVQPTFDESEMHIALMKYVRQVWMRPSASTSGAQLAMTVLVRRACSSPASLARSVTRRLLSIEACSLPVTPQQPLLPLGGMAEDDEPISLLTAPGLEDVEQERRYLERIQGLAVAASRRESKPDALARLFRRTREPVLVFTEYRDTLVQLAASLRRLAIVTLHGGLTATERAESLERFAHGDAQVLIATDAASEGLNLQQRCRLVVNLELPWSPLRLEQRIGRVDRLGQRRRVHALQFIAARTEEENTVAKLFLKIARMQSSTADLHRPPLDERDVARCVIGGEPLSSDPEAARPLPSNMVAPDLRAPARDEAARATAARLLGAGTTDAAPFDRPAVTIVRSRPTSHCYSAFRLTYDDESGVRRCDVVLGVRQPVQAAPLTRAAVRDFFTRHLVLATSVARTAQLDILVSLQTDRRSFIDRACERELAILDDLRRHHARMAARFLQPGLFDRRSERAASAQSAILNEVLEHGAIRLEELTHSAALSAGECDLLFAVIV